MSNQAIQTVTSGADRAKLVLAVAAIVAGIVGFYMLAQESTVVRVGAVMAGLVVGALIGGWSGPGRRFLAFAQDSWSETRRVVWPVRKETIQVTLTVFAFVIAMAIFLWLVDKTLQWVLYDLVLGWKG